MKRIVFGAVALVAIVLLAAGCGGGGGSQLSAEEYSGKLNGICEEFNTKQEEIGAPSSLAELGEKGEQILDGFDSAIAEVEDLNPPDELQEAHDRFVELGHQQRDLLQKTVDAANEGNEAEVNQYVDEADPLDKESDKIATDELNAPACAE